MIIQASRMRRLQPTLSIRNTMIDHQISHILARLEVGLRTDSARLKALEADLAINLQRMRSFGTEQDSPHTWTESWSQQWDNAEGILSRISAGVNEMDDSIASGASERINKALIVWEVIEAEDTRLVTVLGSIRAQASGMSVASHEDWNLLAQSLESHIETIHSCAEAIRVKLELLRGRSPEEVDVLLQTVLARLPHRTGGDDLAAEKYQIELDEAALELEKEQHSPLGFIDVVKALFLWSEAPEERVIKNRSLRL